MALMWEVSKERAWVSGEDIAPASANALRALLGELGAEKVSEASDRLVTTWRAKDIIAFESGGEPPAILVPADAREWIAVYARKVSKDES